MEPSMTFKIDFEKNKVHGYIDDLEAVKQAVFLILEVPRMETLVQFDDYGHELNELVGKDYEFALGSIQKKLEDCLLMDDRITSLDNFGFSKKGENLTISFSVQSIFGDFNYEQEVNTKWSMKKY